MSTRIADQIAAQLKSAGVERVFSLSGNQIMCLYDALFGVGMEIVHVRHEAAAVHMADAWARVTGQVGIALVTAGPGHANALSALYTARTEDVPVVLLSGHSPTHLLGKGAFQEMDQAAMAAPVCKGAWTPMTDVALAQAIPAAIELATAGRPGPVQISMPVDLLDGPAVAGVSETAATAAPEPPADVADVAALLADAERPLVLAGPAAMRAPASQALRELEARGVPTLGLESPRGLRDPAAGAFAEVLPKADLIVLCEKALDFTLAFGASATFAADVRIVDIQPDHELAALTARAAGDRLAGALTCTASAALVSLVDAMPAQAPAHLRSWQSEVDAAARYRPEAWAAWPQAADAALHPVALFAEVQRQMDAFGDWTLVADGGEIGQWAQACLRAPVRVINGVAGAIGGGIPFGIATQLARPDVPTLVVVGDGTFGFHLAELDTAARHGVPLTVLVGNDARWNAEHQIQMTNYGENRLIGCELQATRYADVVAPFGVHAEHAATASELTDALSRALNSPRAAVINVVLDGQAAPTLKRA
ncbi:MAG: thiamine pyrophosphate-binding protein [Pseudomonadota bacterium]